MFKNRYEYRLCMKPASDAELIKILENVIKEVEMKVTDVDKERLANIELSTLDSYDEALKAAVSTACDMYVTENYDSADVYDMLWLDVSVSSHYEED